MLELCQNGSNYAKNNARCQKGFYYARKHNYANSGNIGHTKSQQSLVIKSQKYYILQHAIVCLFNVQNAVNVL